MLWWNLLLYKNKKLTRSTIFLLRNENIYKGFLDHRGKKNVFITLFNPHRLKDQTSCLSRCDPLKVKLALPGRTCSLLFKCVHSIRVVINKLYLDLGHISYCCYFSAAFSSLSFLSLQAAFTGKKAVAQDCTLTGPEALLPTKGQSACIHQIPKKLPASWGFIQSDLCSISHPSKAWNQSYITAGLLA